MFKIPVTLRCIRSNREMRVVVCNVWVVGLSVTEEHRTSHLSARPEKMTNMFTRVICISCIYRGFF